MISAADERFVRLAIKLAWAARRAGGDPFGAVLVRESDQTVVAQDYDRSVALSDPTLHPELAVISRFCRKAQVFALEGYTLYASTEPCTMCSGAIHWARVGRVVFSIAQASLQAISGGKPKPSCASIVNAGGRQIEIVGPLLEEEGLAVFEGYDWAPRLARHAALFRRGGE